MRGQRGLPASLSYQEREAGDVSVTAGQQEHPGRLAGGELLLYFAREVYGAVVCGQCVRVKIRPVAALGERRPLMKEGCQEGYQQGVAAEARRTRQSCGVTDSVGETGSAEQRETEARQPQNSWL